MSIPSLSGTGVLRKRVVIEKPDLSQDGYTQFYHSIVAGDKKGFRVEPIHISLST